jgi:hypothetical protein
VCKIVFLKLLMVLTQFQCRRAGILNIIENKGESRASGQIEHSKNCAIGDAVAQFSGEWRNLPGTVGMRVSELQQLLAEGRFRIKK